MLYAATIPANLPGIPPLNRAYVNLPNTPPILVRTNGGPFAQFADDGIRQRKYLADTLSVSEKSARALSVGKPPVSIVNAEPTPIRPGKDTLDDGKLDGKIWRDGKLPARDNVRQSRIKRGEPTKTGRSTRKQVRVAAYNILNRLRRLGVFGMPGSPIVNTDDIPPSESNPKGIKGQPFGDHYATFLRSGTAMRAKPEDRECMYNWLRGLKLAEGFAVSGQIDTGRRDKETRHATVTRFDPCRSYGEDDLANTLYLWWADNAAKFAADGKIRGKRYWSLTADAIARRGNGWGSGPFNADALSREDRTVYECICQDMTDDAILSACQTSISNVRRIRKLMKIKQGYRLGYTETLGYSPDGDGGVVAEPAESDKESNRQAAIETLDAMDLFAAEVLDGTETWVFGRIREGMTDGDIERLADQENRGVSARFANRVRHRCILAVAESKLIADDAKRFGTVSIEADRAWSGYLATNHNYRRSLAMPGRDIDSSGNKLSEGRKLARIADRPQTGSGTLTPVLMGGVDF